MIEGTPAQERELDDAVAGLIRRGGRLWLVLRLVPLVLVLPPLVAFVLANPPAERLATLVPAVAVFVAIVLWMVAAPSGTLSRRALIGTVLLTLLAVVVVLLDPVSPWLVLFLYPVVAAGWLASVRQSALAIVSVSTVCAAAGWTVLTIPANRIERPLEFALIGFGSLAVSRLVIVNRQLERARAEIARLAAADERLRIARDLHDLLGHGLSLISLKAELAGRLLPADPTRAAAEVADIEGVSRGALQDVRAAVAGYRRLRLDSELLGARAALDAAGVATEIEHRSGSFPDDIDEAFAWSVREGATNVIRHAQARTVSITTRLDDQGARLEIVNDGPHPMGGPAGGIRDRVEHERGSGIAGLAERAAALGGRLEAAPQPDGGFHLVIVIPLGATEP